MVDLSALSPQDRERIPTTPTLLLDKKHAAMALSISERQLDLLVERGEITPIHLGKRCPRFSVRHLADWLTIEQHERDYANE